MIFCAKWKNFWFRFIRVRHCLKIIRTPTGGPFSAMLCKKFLKSTNTIHNSSLFSIFRGCFEVYPLSRTTLIFRGVRRHPVWYTDRALPIWRIVQRWGATRAPGRVCGRQCALSLFLKAQPLPSGNKSDKPRGLGQSPSLIILCRKRIREAGKPRFSDTDNTLRGTAS